MVGCTYHLASRRGAATGPALLLAVLILAGCGESFTGNQAQAKGGEAGESGAAGTAGDGSGSAGSTGGAGGEAGGTSGAGGAAGAGTAGTAGGGGDGGEPARCPSGQGPQMVEAGDICIDSTEVTNAHYAEFLADEAFVANAPPECDWNDTFVQDRDGPTEANAKYPVVWVDWCDAHAFCQWAGKRLCGRVGGGATPWTGYADAEESEWFAACSHGGETVYPYGNDYDEFACSGRDSGGAFGPVVPVGDYSGCVGGSTGLLHMSGNAGEWENSCGGAPFVSCRVRGGSSASNSGALRCDDAVSLARNAKDPWTGIRCCAD